MGELALEAIRRPVVDLRVPTTQVDNDWTWKSARHRSRLKLAVTGVAPHERGRQHRRGSKMANPDGVFIYLGTYPDEASARGDYDVVKDLHATGVVGTYDAAVIRKDENGKVHVNKDEMATRHGGWGGAAAGAVIGILFPPSIIGTAIVGGAIGGVSGHLWRGMSRADVKDLGDVIDAGQAALLIVGESTIQEAVDKAQLKAKKHITKELNANAKEVDKAVKDAAKDLS